MPRFDIIVDSKIDQTPRVLQLGGMFDVPIQQKLSHSWKGDLPIEEKDWSVGLIVGPSGSGKSTIAREVFGEREPLTWRKKSVIDDFQKDLSMQDIAATCSAVGFNTIPSWMKPFDVLSTGEKFRVALARHLLQDADPIVVDEFTSVVDRQVAHIGSIAVAKWVRKRQRKFVGVTCHYDVIEWLQPDWIFEPTTLKFRWRLPRRRPEISIEIARVNYEAWELFAPFHYLTADLHRAAACFVLFANGEPASFGAMLHRPHAKAQNIKGLSRLVTLPDYQGLGLAMILSDHLAAAYKDLHQRFHTYPAHPSLVRSFDHSPNWEMKKKPGMFSARTGNTSTLKEGSKFGGRPCAVFEYVGPAAGKIKRSRELIESNSRGRDA